MDRNILIRALLPSELEAAVRFWSGIEGIGMSPDDNPIDLRAYLAQNPGLSFAAWDEEKLVSAVLCGKSKFLNLLKKNRTSISFEVVVVSNIWIPGLHCFHGCPSASIGPDAHA
jgi:hypothetical protein